jgi:two-component system OmpR family response regulator
MATRSIGSRTAAKPTPGSARTLRSLILDIGLPKLLGFEVLKRLRARNSRLPVLMLTARDGVDDRVRGPRPLAPRLSRQALELAEFKARVRALTRRGMSGAPRSSDTAA